MVQCKNSDIDTECNATFCSSSIIWNQLDLLFFTIVYYFICKSVLYYCDYENVDWTIPNTIEWCKHCVGACYMRLLISGLSSHIENGHHLTTNKHINIIYNNTTQRQRRRRLYGDNIRQPKPGRRRPNAQMPKRTDTKRVCVCCFVCGKAYSVIGNGLFSLCCVHYNEHIPNNYYSCMHTAPCSSLSLPEMAAAGRRGEFSGISGCGFVCVCVCFAMPLKLSTVEHCASEHNKSV